MHNKAKYCKTKYVCLCQSNNAKQHISRPEDEPIGLSRTENFLLSGASKDVKEQSSMVSYVVTQHHFSNAMTGCPEVMSSCNTLTTEVGSDAVRSRHMILYSCVCGDILHTKLR